MKIDSSDSEYEGIPFPQALAMALMESAGIREHIDSEAAKTDKSVRNLGTGMACKAMIGTMFSEESRKPLYRVVCQYAAAPPISFSDVP